MHIHTYTFRCASVKIMFLSPTYSPSSPALPNPTVQPDHLSSSAPVSGPAALPCGALHILTKAVIRCGRYSLPTRQTEGENCKRKSVQFIHDILLTNTKVQKVYAHAAVGVRVVLTWALQRLIPVHLTITV